MSLDDLKAFIRQEAGIDIPTFTTEGINVICSKECTVTKRQYTVTLSLTAYEAWRNGDSLDRVAPELTAEQREFLISYNTPAEWNALFSGDDV